MANLKNCRLNFSRGANVDIVPLNTVLKNILECPNHFSSKSKMSVVNYVDVLCCGSMFTSAFYRSQAKATIGFTYDNSKSIGDSDKDDDDDDSNDSDTDSILSDIGKCAAIWY